jgi:hypothetical protein
MLNIASREEIDITIKWMEAVAARDLESAQHAKLKIWKFQGFHNNDHSERIYRMTNDWCQVIYFTSMDSKKVTSYQAEVKRTGK